MGTTGTTKTRGSTTTIPQDNISLFSQISARALTTLASLSAHPLVSAAAAAYVIGALYLPRCILSLILSPVSVSTLLLLASLLYVGSFSSRRGPDTRPPEQLQPSHSESPLQRPEQQHRLPSPPGAATPDEDTMSTAAVLGVLEKRLSVPEHHHFVEWPRWGPLDVIYEEYEGEEAEGEDEHGVVDSPGCCTRTLECVRRMDLTEELEALRLCCHAGDSDEDSEGGSPAWDVPEGLSFRWEVEEEGLIEISLEEDNLIEIDISACR